MKNYSDAIDELYRISPSFQNVGKSGYHPGMETMKDFDSLSGHPHRSFKTIHIAGTNGKGSVAHFIASILSAAGYRTGLYTSPHLLDLRERIKVLDSSGTCETISEDAVLAFLEKYDRFIKKRKPSFFEITTLMAFDYFRNSGVEIAVIECGLGGRLDSTNIITPVLSIITTIGFDHQDILGDTIEKIAFEKAGIINEGVPVVAGKMPVGALNVISDAADRNRAPFSYAPDSSRNGFRSEVSRRLDALDVSSLDLQSSVQKENLHTVACAVDFLVEIGVVLIKVNIEGIIDAVRHTAYRTGLRGRWETLSVAPRVICDIGHNENALTPVMAQLKTLAEELKPSHFYIIFGMAADKDIASVVHLLPRNATYIFTSARGNRAEKASVLKETVTFGWGGGRNDMVCDSVEEALSAYGKISTKEDLVYIGGSSYVVAEAIEILDRKKLAM